MNNSRVFTTLLLSILVLFICNTGSRAGNPVNGGEIYIELGPDDEDLAHLITSAKGEAALMIPARCKSGSLVTGIEYSVGFPAATGEEIAKRLNPKGEPGTYNFTIECTINGKKSINHFSIRTDGPPVPVQVKSGPYSESLSNIEDNRTSPGGNQDRISLRIKLTCDGFRSEL